MLGNIIPATNVRRSQFQEFKKRFIDEAIPVKMDVEGTSSGHTRRLIEGNIFPAVKRSAEPVILEVQPGTQLHEPVRMDAYGMSLG